MRARGPDEVFRDGDAHDRLRIVVRQPDVWFTGRTPIPIRVCGALGSMDAGVDDPGEWYHPDRGMVGMFWASTGRVEEDPEGFLSGISRVRGRRCRFCGFVVRE
jgi:hypothetical protein